MNSRITSVLLLQIYFIIRYTFKLYKCIKRLRIINSYDGCVTAKIIDVKGGEDYFLWYKRYRYYLTYQYTVDGIAYQSESLWKYKMASEPCSGEDMKLNYDQKNPKAFAPSSEKEILRRCAVQSSIIAMIFFLLFAYYWIRIR